MKTLCESLNKMPRSGIRVIMDLAMGMEDVIHMELGEPGFQTPDHIKEAACKAIHDGFTKYTANNGLLSLREACLNKLDRDGAKVDIHQIGIAPGSVFALAQAMMAVTNPGDEVLLSDPGWPNYYMQTIAMERTPVFYPLREDNGFEPRIEDLEPLITPRTRVILINTPSNPTGGVYSKETVEKLVEFAKKHDIYIISDEVYDKIVFDGEHHSPLNIDPNGNVISIYGVSKAYAMTGWRVGYYSAPSEVAPQMNKILEPYVSCASAVSQKAAEAALNGPQDCIGTMVEAYRERRDLVLDTLSAEGFEFSRPKGAFYLMANVSKAGMDSYTFAKELLKETGVATAPGLTFGKDSDKFIRFSFCADTEQIREGINRFCAFYKSKV
ncbi:pyridoxal phosphate-dependent aminotransferase [uncultured Pseudodesulfovibrio sp.]|uniref:pyridoxal phosphate-dependent aminotransferase n=1 Tax=uncultured Pseudodesulfovibrio sp. TaxID=2035858 RepID=UPI0029C6685C|nr:pyridoxal phosphate-dependent aminotransferase [uncultured Pseudodesulfovibrio sp.]